MAIIFWLFILCLFVAFWYSALGARHGLTGEYGTFAYFFGKLISKSNIAFNGFLNQPRMPE